MQANNIQENNTSFKAKMIIRDRGKIFNSEQKIFLTQFAETVGTKQDTLMLGTKMFKAPKIHNYYEKPNTIHKDVIFLSLVGGLQKEFLMNYNLLKLIASIKNNVDEFVEIPAEQRERAINEIAFETLLREIKQLSKLSKKNSTENTDEKKNLIKQKFKEFFNHNQNNESFGTKIKNLFKKIF